MDPLSISTGVLATLQVALSILKFCYDLRSTKRSLPRTFTQVVDELRDLRNVLEAIQSVLDSAEFANDTIPGDKDAILPFSASLRPALSSCLVELLSLEDKINPSRLKELQESKTKMLLETLSWHLDADDTKESLCRLQRCKASIDLAISSQNLILVRDVHRLTIALDYKLTTSCSQLDVLTRLLNTVEIGKQEKAVMEWLSPLKPCDAHRAASIQHQAGTSKWFFESHSFQSWIDSQMSFIWVTGPPGSGKTTLLSQAVEKVFNSLNGDRCKTKPAFGVSYCDFRVPNSQNVAHVLGSILSQLCAQTGTFPDVLMDWYDASTGSNQWAPPSTEMMLDAFRSLSKTGKLYIFVDGLDESAAPRLLAESLATLSKNQSNIYIFATSRNDVVIQRVLQFASRIMLDNCAGDIDLDIQRYVTQRLRDDELNWLPPQTQDLILDKINQASNGMFRWAKCQIDALSRARTIRDIKRTFQSLPPGLDDTYARILAGILPTDVHLVKKTLEWLVFGTGTLTLNQLWDALAVEWGTDEIDEDARLRSAQDIINLGQSLISVTPEGSVTLAHLSVRDYLMSDTILAAPETAPFAMCPEKAHRDLAKSCLTYLCFAEQGRGPAPKLDDYLKRLQEHPLLKYATKAWFYHLRRSEPDQELTDFALRFFMPEARPHFMAWVQMLNADANFKWDVYPRHATSLYHAASLGLHDIVQSLLSMPGTLKELNAPGSRFGGTPIHAAAIREHVNIIRLLLDAGADPSKPDFNGVTPLHSAASQGSTEVVKLLLRHGARTDAKDGMDGKTPSMWAKMSRHSELSRLIDEDLESGPPNEVCGIGTTGSRSDITFPGAADGHETWKPKLGFFPRYYENRSGIDSSLIMSVELEGQKTELDTSFVPRKDPRDLDGTPVW